MLYDKEVDKTIIKILHDTNRQSYNNLHKNTCNTYRKITRASFDFHVSKLKEEKIIEKKEVYEGKIKKSYYYLTADAKQKYRLQILSCKTEKEKTNFITMIENEKRLIYYLLLLYEYRFARTNPEQFRLNLPEKELDIHLSKCNTSRNDLFIDKSFAKNGFKYSKRQHVTAFKTEKDIHVYKFEKFNKTGELTSTFYNLNLPGFSIKGFKENIKKYTQFADFTQEDLEDSLNNLLNEKIFQFTIEYDGEPRYEIINQNLDIFIKNLLFLVDYIIHKMSFVWVAIRRPSFEDIKWLELFIGFKDTEALLNKIREHKKNIKKNQHLLQHTKDIIQYIEKEIDILIENYKQEFRDIIKEYPFLFNDMIKMVYPKHLQKVLIG